MTSSSHKQFEQILKDEEASVLVEITIITKLGAQYEFPDMELNTLRNALPPVGRIIEGAPSMSLINASLACLVIPFNIIQRIYNSQSGETYWESSTPPIDQ